MKLKYHLVLFLGMLLCFKSIVAWPTEPETKNEKAIIATRNEECINKHFLLSSFDKKSHISAQDEETEADSKSSDGEGDPPSSDETEPADELSPEGIEALDKTVKQYGLFIDLINPNKGFDLPLGIKKSVGGEESQDGKEVSIIIQDMEFSPSGAKMNVCMNADIPLGKNKSISFRGRNIAFNPGGISGEGTLTLASDLQAFDILDGKASFNILGGRGKTYVNFDCNGYAGMGIDTEIEFKDLLVPAPYSADSKSTVKTTLALSFGQDEFFDDIIAEITLDPFTIDKPGIRDFSFELIDAIIDLSDKRNTEPFNFPSGYSNGFDSNPKLWTGFYAKNISVTIPKKYSLKGNEHTFSASNLYIDNTGVTGTFTGSGIIPLKDDKEGWQMSLDELSIALLQNKLKSIGTKGVVKLPIQAKNGKLGLAYNGMVASNGDYSISAAITDTVPIKFPAFHSTLNLYKGSNVYLEEIDNKTHVGANLYGELDIDFNVTNNFKIENIGFKGLRIQNKKPYFHVETIYGGIGCHFENFPVNDLDLAFKKKGDLFGLGLGTTINFTGKEKGFGASLGLTYFTEVKKVDNDLSFNFKELKIDSINIKTDMDAFSLDGGLKAYKKDQVYGTGFLGNLKMKIQPGLFIDVTGQFGKITNEEDLDLSFRYFYADALLGLPPSKGMTIFPGFDIYGFGGGLSYHMDKTGDKKQISESATDTTLSNQAGISRSGLSFKPNINAGIGLEASVFYGCSGSPRPYNGVVTFGLDFTSSWGLNKIYFKGETFFMNKLYNIPENPFMRATADISMQFTKPKQLIGNFKTSINVYETVKGDGQADFLFSKDRWHVNVGKPDNKFNLRLLGGLFKSESYFMIGNDIGDMPAPPQPVLDLLGMDHSDSNIPKSSTSRSKADLDSIQGGKGIAFGTCFTIGDPEIKKFLIFEGKFYGTLGGDFLLKDYSKFVCAGAGNTPGINGWYAKAQVYAALEAMLGVNIQVFRKKIKETIFDAEFAALLKAAGPNPFYASGNIHASYNVLGGLAKGKCDFEVELGKECTMIETSLENIKMISDVAPKESAGKVSVFTKPQVTFNMIIGNIYTGYLDGVETRYKVEITDFYISKKGSKNRIPGQFVWSDDGTTVAFKTDMVLPELSDLQGYVKTTLKQKKGNDFVELDGGSSEDTTFFFTTDAEPDTIPHSNVAFSYPIIDQYNFYKDQHPHGYIKLDQGQNTVFKLDKGWTTEARMKSRQTNSIETFKYNSNRRDSIYFDFPDLDMNTVYELTLVKIPPVAKAVDSNVKLDSIQKSLNDSLDAKVKVTTKSLDGNISEGKEKIIYKAFFRTSQFETFERKISSMTKSNIDFVRFQYDGIHLLRMDLTTVEAFDKFELFGEGNQPELIEVFAQPKDSLNDWYGMIIDEGYRKLGDKYLNVQKPFRFDYITLGKTHNIYPHYAVKLITDNIDTYDLSTRNYINVPLNQTLLLSYDIEKYAFEACKGILGTSDFPFIYNERRDDKIIHKNIKVKFRYYLPGVDDVYFEADKVLLIGNM